MQVEADFCFSRLLEWHFTRQAHIDGMDLNRKEQIIVALGRKYAISSRKICVVLFPLYFDYISFLRV